MKLLQQQEQVYEMLTIHAPRWMLGGAHLRGREGHSADLQQLGIWTTKVVKISQIK